jgi:hypothetical protein
MWMNIPSRFSAAPAGIAAHIIITQAATAALRQFLNTNIVDSFVAYLASLSAGKNDSWRGAALKLQRCARC